MKTAGDLQARMYRLATPLLITLLLVLAVVSIWTPIAHPEIASRWFTLPNLFWLLPVPVLVLLSAWGIQRGVKNAAHYSPFLLTLLLVFLGLSGLGISIWPLLIPPSITLWDAAAPPQSLGFMLVGALFIIPIILVYTFWSYYVFRGKVSHEQGYH
jgi:cytochrome d ubiquinol oxidase subunit II